MTKEYVFYFLADVKMSTVFNATFLVDHINENTSDWPDSCTRCHDRTYEMRGFIKSEKEIEKVNYLLTVREAAKIKIKFF